MDKQLNDNPQVKYVPTTDTVSQEKWLSKFKIAMILVSIIVLGMVGCGYYVMGGSTASEVSSSALDILEMEVHVEYIDSFDIPSCARGEAPRSCGVKLCSKTSCCSCNEECEENNTCCHDYSKTCKDAPSCKNGPGARTCGEKVCTDTSCCSCHFTCEEENNCCVDFNDTCMSTPTAEPTEEVPSCASGEGDRNCGLKLCTPTSCCSCHHTCDEDNTCCHDYDETCRITPSPTDEVPSCSSGEADRNCGFKICTQGSCCSCDTTCEEDNTCCHDYEELCRITPSPTDEVPSCASGEADRNCGFKMCTPSSCCSCDSTCEEDSTCCHDYDELCRITPSPTDEVPSCSNGPAARNCGFKICTPNSCCSCESTCEQEDKCCHDYSETCKITPSPTDESFIADSLLI